METCSFCGLPVIGLRGQDDFLDPYYFKDSSEDLLVREAFAFGTCHARCLVGSRWAEFWLRRRLENLANVRGFQSFRGINCWHLVNPRSSDLVWAMDAGFLVWLQRDMLRNASREAGTIRIPVRE